MKNLAMMVNNNDYQCSKRNEKYTKNKKQTECQLPISHGKGKNA